MKFGRVFNMKVQVDDLGQPDNTILLSYPLTVEFEIARNTLASANTGRFRIYNLQENTRKRIFHDRYDTLNYRQLVFNAGYQDQRPTPLAFQGNIIQAYSQRQGTEWVTDIECYDGGFGIINSQVSATLPAGTSMKSAIQTVMGSLKNISPGVIGAFTDENSRGVSLMGNSWDVIGKLAGGGTAFVDLEKANVLKTNEYLSNSQGISLITSDTGLLGTPRRHDARIDVDILFEPRAVVGQIIELRSLETINNGTYMVVGVAHRGTISGAVDRGVITTLSLWAGTERLQAAL